ncbi:MAG: hypothetical protein HUJ26_14445 [Planctomycetaceae bacterium]|nr:hypothetical protein [Planctomycetaceae bacterium]
MACFVVVSTSQAQESKFYRGQDVTAKVDIEHSPLKKARGDEYHLTLTIENKSAEDLPGPLVLVIEKTGKELLLPKKYDGRFAKGGDGFLMAVAPNRVLKAKQTQKLRQLTLETLIEPKTDPTESFKLTAKLYQLRTTPDTQVASANQKGKSNPLIPLAGQAGNARMNGGANNSSGIQPVPDPGPEPTPLAGNEGNGDKQLGGVHAPRPRVPTNAEVARATKATDAWTEKLFDIKGVHTVATGWHPDGSSGVTVFVKNFADKKKIPDQLDGVPVNVLVQEQAELYQTRGGRVGFPVHPLAGNCFDDPTRYFERPIPIGVSGWNQKIDACATGTLGCRLENTNDESEKFILSNSHVLADNGRADLSFRFAQAGDPVIQPGPIDFNCAFASDSVVGQLYDWTTAITTNNFVNLIDASIATTTPLLTSTATPCNGYGVPSEVTQTASFDLEVMKYGRTTLFTTGTVLLVNSTISVIIADNPADPTMPITAIYGGQIGVVADSNFFGSFSGPGDSGSLVVTRDGRHPVGLLFAGNFFITYMNPIDTVLGLIGPGTLQVDGEPAPTP